MTEAHRDQEGKPIIFAHLLLFLKMNRFIVIPFKVIINSCLKSLTRLLFVFTGKGASSNRVMFR